MPRCGCASEDCSCTVVGGNGITVTGSGTKTDPYTVTSNIALNLVVADTGSVDMTLTGSGTVADPTTISAIATGTIPSVSVQTFTTIGIWTRPTGKSIARVLCIGAGGGGGSGANGATGTNKPGGGGGGGGGASINDFYITDLPATVPITIGTGGAGAVAQSGTVPGSAGANGTATTFGTYLSADGGQGGSVGGGGASGGNSLGGNGGGGTFTGGTGGTAVPGPTPMAITPAVYGLAASGGGAGQGPNTTNTSAAPTNGGQNNTFFLGGGNAGGGTGFSYTTPYHGGTGGGGGGGYPSFPSAQNGGNGVRGGGGGGGGAGSTSSGAGGTGGAGFVAVTTW